MTDHAALILDPGQPHAALLQQFGQRLVAAWAANFLVMTEGEHDGACRAEPARGQKFRCLHHGDQRALVVDRAAPPDITIGDDAPEGGVLPLVFGSRRNRHDVDMRHHQHGIERRVLALPCIEECLAADDFAAAGSREGWIGCVHPVAKAGKGRLRARDGRGVGTALVGNRLETDGFGKMLRRAFGIDA